MIKNKHPNNKLDLKDNKKTQNNIIDNQDNKDNQDNPDKSNNIKKLMKNNSIYKHISKNN